MFRHKLYTKSFFILFSLSGIARSEFKVNSEYCTPSDFNELCKSVDTWFGLKSGLAMMPVGGLISWPILKHSKFFEYQVNNISLAKFLGGASFCALGLYNCLKDKGINPEKYLSDLQDSICEVSELIDHKTSVLQSTSSKSLDLDLVVTSFSYVDNIYGGSYNKDSIFSIVRRYSTIKKFASLRPNKITKKALDKFSSVQESFTSLLDKYFDYQVLVLEKAVKVVKPLMNEDMTLVNEEMFDNFSYQVSSEHLLESIDTLSKVSNSCNMINSRKEKVLHNPLIICNSALVNRFEKLSSALEKLRGLVAKLSSLIIDLPIYSKQQNIRKQRLEREREASLARLKEQQVVADINKQKAETESKKAFVRLQDAETEYKKVEAWSELSSIFSGKNRRR